VGHRKFFYAERGRHLIIDCYRLARFFRCDPDVFLRKPCAKVQQHMDWADVLMKLGAKED